jgi:AcrR family transcriptional regulator
VQIQELRSVPTGERAAMLAQRARDRKARQDRMGEQRRALLLDVALQTLIADGWEGFNLRDMASKAGYSAGALYAYFDSKDALLHAVRGRWLEAVRVAIESARVPKSKSATHRVAAEPMAAYQLYLVKMQAWWDAIAKHPLGVPMLLWPVWAGESESLGDRGVLAEMELLTREIRNTLPSDTEAAAPARAMHGDILVAGLGYLVALGKAPSPAVLAALGARFNDTMRQHLSAQWQDGARGSGQAHGPDGQPDLFSLDID